MDNHFGGVIWTDHAIQRLYERGIKQGDAWATWRNSDQCRKGASGNWVYYKTYGNTKIEVVANKVEKASGPTGLRPGGEWVILSVWSKPVWEKTSVNNVHKKSWFWDWLYKITFKR